MAYTYSIFKSMNRTDLTDRLPVSCQQIEPPSSVQHFTGAVWRPVQPCDSPVIQPPAGGEGGGEGD